MRPAALAPLFSSVETLPGVGPGTVGLLKRLHLNRVIDLLWHLPTGCALYPLTSLKKMPWDQSVTLSLKILGWASNERKRSPVARMMCEDQLNLDGRMRFIDLVFFQGFSYLQKKFPIDSLWLVSGKIESFQERLQMTHPERMCPLREQDKWSPHHVTYPLTTGLQKSYMEAIVAKALKRLPHLPEWLSPQVIGPQRWSSWYEAVQRLHAVTGEKDLAPETLWRQRLAFDELLAEQLTLLLARRKAQQQKGEALSARGALQTHLLTQFGFSLTRAQEKALGEITVDLQRSEPMGRLLHGDVGSGKTIVAFCAMAQAVDAGFQAVFLAPTEILAQQQAQLLSCLLEGTALQVGLLTGSTRQRKLLFEKIQQGNIQMLVGTHAILEDQVVFPKLGLVVIDEQHRFGVVQRLKLMQKGKSPHLLVMSATPIPRTFELTLYGDLHVSRLDEKPAGRTPVQTLILPQERLGEVVEMLQRRLEKGEQTYWVCPLVNESETMDLAAATARFNHLSAAFPKQTGLLHGRLKATEKKEVMDAFRAGKIKILVATTVIEVGLDVPDATIMVIEHAERFGLAQLHQLRGRVGRGTQQAMCLLIYTSPLTYPGKERLKTMRDSQDGFFIAEQDWRLRGGGDRLGVRQSGLPSYRLADLECHGDLLPLARHIAEETLSRDPSLSTPEGQALRILLYLFEKDQAIHTLQAG